MKKFDAENLIVDKMGIFFWLILNELHHDKTCFLHIFCGLLIFTSFSILTITLRGVSNKHCLLPFFHLVFVENCSVRAVIL